MRTRVRKWGNSLAVRIPSAFARDLGLDSDTTVELAVADDCLVVRPERKPAYSLNALLAMVEPENLHGEVDVGPAVGGEEW